MSVEQFHHHSGSQSRADRRRSVTVSVRNQTIDLPRELRPLLRALQTSVWTPSDDADEHHACRQLESLLPDAWEIAQRLAARIPTPNVRPNVGLLPIVLHLLRRAGYRIPPCPRPCALPRQAPVPGELGGDPAFLEFVERNDLGLVKCVSGPVDRARLIAQVAHAWPNHRVIVATASIDQAKRLRRQLTALRVKTGLITDKHCPRRPHRVVVSTFAGLGHTRLEANKCDFLFVANAIHALGQHAQRALMMDSPRFRLMAFMEADLDVSSQERDWLIATFGLASITIVGHGRIGVTPEVLWLPFVSTNGGANTLRRLWSNERRNSTIAEAACRLSEGELGRLDAVLPSGGAAFSSGRPNQTIVLVAGVEQAVSVAKLLPGWPIVTDPTIDDTGMPVEEQNILRERRVVPPAIERPMIQTFHAAGERLIVTLSGAPAVLMPPTANAITAVIWTGAGPHKPVLPECWLTVSPDRPRRLVLIDIADSGAGKLDRWTRLRRRDYREAEWFAAGADREEEKIRAFLAARPREGGRRE